MPSEQWKDEGFVGDWSELKLYCFYCGRVAFSKLLRGVCDPLPTQALLGGVLQEAAGFGVS